MAEQSTVRWRRRKNARPSEILTDGRWIASPSGVSRPPPDSMTWRLRAGVTKGTLYRYFPNKEQLFKAVVRAAIVPNIERLEATVAGGSVAALLTRLATLWVESIAHSRISAIPKLVFAEAGNFPELARFYLDEVVHRMLGLLTGLLRRGIETGEIRPIDPEHTAHCVVAPLLFSVLWQHSLGPFDNRPFDVEALVRTHVDLLLHGLLVDCPDKQTRAKPTAKRAAARERSTRTMSATMPVEHVTPPRSAAAPAPAPKTNPPAPSRWGRRFLILVLLCAAAGGGLWYYLGQRPHDDSRLDLQGNIDVRQVNLGFKVDGRIATLAVDEGDTVAAGQVIATLDKSYFEDDLRLARARKESTAANLAKLENGSRPEEIAQARAQLGQQQATLVRARQDFTRANRLLRSGAIGREEFDQYESAQGVAEANVKYAQETLRLAEIGPRAEDIQAARAQLAQQQAALIQSERRLADSDLIAPGSGTILTRAREKGAIVQAGETVFTLTLTSPVWVRTYVNERDLGRIEPDMVADVRTDSAPDKVYRGKIGFISPTAEFTPKTVETRELRTNLVYRLRVIVDNPDGGLRQGMPVTVTLNLMSKK